MSGSAATARGGLAGGDGGAVRVLAAAALGALGAALLYRLGIFLEAGAGAVAFPFNLDYGEGVVWQQLLLMADGRAYGDIARFPSIVFHYPPVYHALAALAAAGTGLDQLAAGRLLSLLAALSIGAVCGALAFRALRAELGAAPAFACACMAGLATFTHGPVALWAPLMRVDMVAVAFAFLGVYFGVRSPERPVLVHAAALCFVLSVYAKQTSLAAPAATFLVLALVRPRLAAAGAATAVAAGGLLLAALAWATEGGFLRHLVLYNINRFEAHRLQMVAAVLVPHAPSAMAAVAAVAEGARRFGREGRARAVAESLRRGIALNERDRILAVAAAHLAFTTPMLVGVGKSGSSWNYFIEWMCVWNVPIGFAVSGAAAVAAGRAPLRAARPLFSVLVAAGLAVQALVAAPPPGIRRAREPAWPQEMRDLVGRVAAASGPVVSDDMVLLLRAGKRVVWEPAIFAELATTGLWDEGPFVAMVEAGAFAFFVTNGQRGDPTFDSRYTPAVARALDAAYPRKERRAGYVLHLPAE